MQQRQTKPPEWGDIMLRGWTGLTLFGAGATVLIFTPSMTGAQAGVGGTAGIALLVFLVAVIFWGLGGLIIALPIWSGLHTLGLRDWLPAVAGGAVLVALAWFLVGDGAPTIAGKGAIAGAVAGWGLWWMAYRRGSATP